MKWIFLIIGVAMLWYGERIITQENPTIGEGVIFVVMAICLWVNIIVERRSK